MSKDVIIVGSGPAGLSAAVAAAQNGAKVTVIDENPKPGGQLFKQIHKFFGSEEHHAGVRGIDIGSLLLDKCKEYNVEIMLNTFVWGIFDNGHEVAIKKRDGTTGRLHTKKLILATGAKEKPLAFPGWTLPGVMGAGCAQTLMNMYRVLPGKKILMVGTGNVGLIVSYQFLQAGADVVGVVEVLPRISGYVVHARKILRMGVPMYTSHTVCKAIGEESVEGAVIAKVDQNCDVIKNSQIMLDVDLVCLAVGLAPNVEIARSLKCEMIYKRELGGLVPVHNKQMKTSLDDVYVCGDLSAIEEASVAMVEGSIAGLAVSEALGNIKAKEAEDKLESCYENLQALRSGPRAEGIRKANMDVIERCW